MHPPVFSQTGKLEDPSVSQNLELLPDLCPYVMIVRVFQSQLVLKCIYFR